MPRGGRRCAPVSTPSMTWSARSPITTAVAGVKQAGTATSPPCGRVTGRYSHPASPRSAKVNNPLGQEVFPGPAGRCSFGTVLVRGERAGPHGEHAGGEAGDFGVVLWVKKGIQFADPVAFDGARRKAEAPFSGFPPGDAG